MGHELAQIILLLASIESSDINDASIAINGGTAKSIF